MKDDYLGSHCRSSSSLPVYSVMMEVKRMVVQQAADATVELEYSSPGGEMPGE